MKAQVILWCLAIVVAALVGPRTADAQAGKKPVKTTKEWSGSVADEKLAKDAPSCIATAKALENLWKEWQIADALPKVDFTKEIVVLTTTRGSRVTLALSLDDKGDLRIGGIATLDLRPGFRYVIATASREGVKTVNGKELPKD